MFSSVTVTSVLFFIGCSSIDPVQAQWEHRLNSPCGRDEGSDSVLYCGTQPCPLRMTKERQRNGGGPKHSRIIPSYPSNSLFEIYDTNGPDLTMDACMLREGIVHSASPHQLAISCSSQAQYNTKQWYCGSQFTSNSCEYDENLFDTTFDCGSNCLDEQNQPCGCTNTLSSGVETGHRVLLRYDTSVVNVGDTAWVLGSRSKDPIDADKRYRDYLEFEDENCHGHVHLLNFARARLCQDPECDNPIAAGHKVSFCVAETYSYGPESGWSCSGPGGAAGGSFSCSGVQGLSPGCADLYATYTDGNWIDVTHVPRGNYFLEVTAGAGCRNKDYDTCIKCSGYGTDQAACVAETGCVWDNSSGQCQQADWCCMEQGLPDVWLDPQAGPEGRCGTNPKCYLFQEPQLDYYDNNVVVVPVELIPYGVDSANNVHEHPCNCEQPPPPPPTPVCGDGTCDTAECEAFDESPIGDLACSEDCCTSSSCQKGCPKETGPDGEIIESYCQDGIDNDGDDIVDCMDADCYLQNESWGCGQNPCSDGIDNDEDDLTDCDDPDCSTNEICLTTCINTGGKCTPGSDDTCCNSAEGDMCICSNPTQQKGCKCVTTM